MIVKDMAFREVLSKVYRVRAPWLQPGFPGHSRFFLALGARTLLGAKGIATRSKDATRGSWHYY